MVVPRDVNVEAVQKAEESTLPLQPTDMDERITVPQGVCAAGNNRRTFRSVSEDLVEPDIIQTGEVTFLPAGRRRDKRTIGER